MGAQPGPFRVGVDVVGGQFRGVGVAFGLRGGHGVVGGGDPGFGGRDRFVDHRVVLVGGQQLGQGAFGVGEGGLGGGEAFSGGDPGRVGDHGGVGVDVGVVVGEGVDAVVGGQVLEGVLDPPATPQPGQQGGGGGGEITGEDLQHRGVVFEQGELAGRAVAVDLDHLVGQGDRLAGPGGSDPEAAHRGRGDRGQIAAPPGQPVRAGVAAGP